MPILAKWSVEDYHKMIEAGILCDRAVELIAGDILKMSPEGSLHRYINHTVADYLRSILGTQAIVSEAHPITLPDSEPEPDIVVVRSPYTLYFNHHPHPEDVYWLIEIADGTLVKDLGIKKTIYAQAKIREYWVIDLTSNVLNVFQNPAIEDYQIKQHYQEGFISPLAFPHLQIAVATLFGK